jgi:hypothetical protein
MENTLKASPRDFFLYLFSSAALYYCALWLVSLLYDCINYAFGSTQLYYENAWIPSSMRWAMASLIVIFPLYIVITRSLNRDVEQNPEKKNLTVRKWLQYLTLTLAGIALVIDSIALLNQFLAGEFVATFMLKVAATALVAGLIFAYYLLEIRRDMGASVPQRAAFRYTALVIVLASIVAGFLVIGSPTEARNRQYDATRVQHLEQLQSQLVYYYQRKQSLPKSLAEVSDPLSGFMVPTDPVTGEAYSYEQKGERAFELCAVFATETTNTMNGSSSVAPVYPDLKESFWQHASGPVCFERTIDPELYPPIKAATR